MPDYFEKYTPPTKDEEEKAWRYKNEKFSTMYEEDDEEDLYKTARVIRKEDWLKTSSYKPEKAETYKSLIINKPRENTPASEAYTTYWQGSLAPSKEIEVKEEAPKKEKPVKELTPTPETVETKAPPVIANTPEIKVDVEATKEAVQQETEAPKKESKAKAKKADDLTKIEGVGPKAAEALTNAGMGTYADIAKGDANKIKEVLTEASSRMAHLDPTSWPKQAQMAADGKWDELKVWQDNTKGGVE